MQVVPDSREAGQALAMLQAGQRLPRPQKAQSAARLPELPAPEAAPHGDPDVGAYPITDPDPITEASQKALSELAGILFEEEDEEVQATRRGLAAIVTGQGGGSIAVDRTKIMLHLSQVVELQGRAENSRALDELERAVDWGWITLRRSSIWAGCFRKRTGWKAPPAFCKSYKASRFCSGGRLVLAQAYQKMGKSKEAAIEYLEALRLADLQLVPHEQTEALSQMYDPLIETQLAQTPEVHAKLSDNIASFLLRPNWRNNLSLARQQLPTPALAARLYPWLN